MANLYQLSKPLILLLALFLVSNAYIITPHKLPDLVEISPKDMSDTNQASLFYQNILPFLAGQYYYGNWFALDKQIPSYFGHSSGFTRLNFGKSQNSTTHEHFAIKFVAGNYTDQDFLFFILPRIRPSVEVDWDNSLVIYKNITALVFLLPLGFKQCPLDLSVSFIDTETRRPFNVNSSNPRIDNLGLKIFINSLACEIKIETNTLLINDPVVMSQIVPYSVFMYLSIFLNIIAYTVLYFKMKKNPLSCLDLSLGTLYFLTIFDVFLAIDHIFSGSHTGGHIPKILLQSIGILYSASAVLVSLVFVLEVSIRVTELPWRDVMKKIYGLRLACSPFNLISFVFSFGVLVNDSRLNYLWMLSLFLLPQIVQNAYIDRRFRWNHWYIEALFLPKILYFIYTEGYSYNLFRRTPHQFFCGGITVAIVIQIIILAIQTKFPRFGAQSPRPYKIIQVAQAHSQSCSICLQDFKDMMVDGRAEEFSQANKASGDFELVITPCNHEFHLKCLRDWFTCKFECPYCRCSLPFSIDFDGPRQAQMDSLVEMV